MLQPAAKTSHCMSATVKIGGDIETNISFGNVSIYFIYSNQQVKFDWVNSPSVSVGDHFPELRGDALVCPSMREANCISVPSK